jgi:hypothetical protein
VQVLESEDWVLDELYEERWSNGQDAGVREGIGAVGVVREPPNVEAE